MPSWVSALPAIARSLRTATMDSSGIQIGPIPLRCSIIPSGYRVSTALARKPSAAAATLSFQCGAMVLPT